MHAPAWGHAEGEAPCSLPPLAVVSGSIFSHDSDEEAPISPFSRAQQRVIELEAGFADPASPDAARISFSRQAMVGFESLIDSVLDTRREKEEAQKEEEGPPLLTLPPIHVRTKAANAPVPQDVSTTSLLDAINIREYQATRMMQPTFKMIQTRGSVEIPPSTRHFGLTTAVESPTCK